MLNSTRPLETEDLVWSLSVLLSLFVLTNILILEMGKHTEALEPSFLSRAQLTLFDRWTGATLFPLLFFEVFFVPVVDLSEGVGDEGTDAEMSRVRPRHSLMTS